VSQTGSTVKEETPKPKFEDVIPTQQQRLQEQGTLGPVNVIVDGPASPVITGQPKEDGGYIETESYTESDTRDGVTIIYETKITRTYDKNKNLISTKKDGPNEISRMAAIPGFSTSQTPANPSRTEDTLSAEYARATNGVFFDTSLANEVLAKLNAERAGENLPPYSMSSGDLMKAAKIKAADMAAYGHANYNSSVYGTLENLLVRYGVTVNAPQELLWQTSGKSADQIHARFQAQGFDARMSKNYSEVAVAVVEKSGYVFVIECYN
jgi:uncharacterized protein YkwD